MEAGGQIGPFSDYEGLIDALRAMKNARGLSDLAVDDIAGLPRGYTGKILGVAQQRTLGLMSLGVIVQALACRMVLIDDPESLAKLQGRYDQKHAGQARFRNHSHGLSMNSRAVLRIRPLIFKDLAKGLTEGRKKISKRKRRAIARHAIQTRWKRERARRRAVRLAKQRAKIAASASATPAQATHPAASQD